MKERHVQVVRACELSMDSPFKKIYRSVRGNTTIDSNLSLSVERRLFNLAFGFIFTDELSFGDRLSLRTLAHRSIVV